MAAVNVLKQTFHKIIAQDPQFRCNFEVVFLPYINFRNIGIGTLASVATSALDSIVAKLYIKSISMPNFGEFTYEMFNSRSFVTAIEYAKEVVFTFYEDDLAVVRTYLMTLRELVGSYDNTYGFLFNDNQDAAKKNVIISPLMGNGFPGPAVIKVEGLVFKNMGGIDLDQGAAEPYEIPVTFAINRIDWITAVNAF